MGMKTNRVVVITGAAGGIGAELVRRFLENGDTVIATDLKDEGLQKLKTRTDHKSLLTIAANISDFNECERLSEIARANGGRVDVLINCAGYFPIHPFEDISPEEWREIIDVKSDRALSGHPRASAVNERARMGAGDQLRFSLRL